MKKDFLRSGLRDVYPHNVIELILFFSIPRQDTNEIAHRLIDRFKSVSGVLDADFDDLITVPGISEHSATLIKLFRSMSERYFTEKLGDGLTLSSAEDLAAYFSVRYICADAEKAYLLLLDSSFRPLYCEPLSEGTVSSCKVDFRFITERVCRYKAFYLVLAHNHPNGLPIPSSNDLEVTSALRSGCELIGCKLLDHIIIGRNTYASLLFNKQGRIKLPTTEEEPAE